MRPTSFHILALVVALPLISSGQKRLVVSPDHHVRASITVGAGNCPENRLAMLNENGRVIYRKNFFSIDCEHGGVIVHGDWTPDSQFFVFNVESTGGHQPGHLPVNFYSRLSNKLYRLEDFVGYIVAQDFVLKTPDTVKTEKQKAPGQSERIPVEVSLKQLVRSRDHQLRHRSK